jgi:hypothetical protein
VEAISLILDALGAGAAAIAKGVSSEAGKDAYQKLKALIQRKLSGKTDAELTLIRYEKEPDVWKERLKTILADAFADQDKDIIQIAQKLLTVVNPQQAGKYNVLFTGNVQGVVQGDNAQVKMNFGSKSPKDKE